MREKPDGMGLTADLMTRADFATLEARDKEMNFIDTGLTFGVASFLDYTVPAGKTFYVTNFGFAIYASAAADGDNNQFGSCDLKNQTDTTYHGTFGGNGGGAITLPKPIKFTAGKVVRFQIWSYANHDVDVEGYVGGYEV
jgi:hypothetical protein